MNKMLWAVRTEQEALFLEHHMIAVDGHGTGDLSPLPADPEAFKAAYEAANAQASAGERATGAHLLYRLVHEVQTGDCVVLAHGQSVHLGVVEGGYVYAPTVPGCEHRRRVRWEVSQPRSAFSREALRETGSSPVALFAVKRYAGEFFSALKVPYLEERPVRAARPVRPEPAARSGEMPEAVPVEAVPAAALHPQTAHTAERRAQDAAAHTVPNTTQDAIQSSEATERFLLDALRRCQEKGTLEALTLDLLRAMGYETREKRGGGWRIARAELPAALKLYAFCGTASPVLGADEYGILFTLSASGGGKRVQVVDGAAFAELVLRHYADLDARFRREIPLKAVYLPVE